MFDIMDGFLSEAKESLSGSSTHILTAFIVTSAESKHWALILAGLLVAIYVIVWGYHLYKKLRSPQTKEMLTKCEAMLKQVTGKE